jgi:hypothetical protein
LALALTSAFGRLSNLCVRHRWPNQRWRAYVPVASMISTRMHSRRLGFLGRCQAAASSSWRRGATSQRHCLRLSLTLSPTGPHSASSFRSDFRSPKCSIGDWGFGVGCCECFITAYTQHSMAACGVTRVRAVQLCLSKTRSIKKGATFVFTHHHHHQLDLMPCKHAEPRTRCLSSINGMCD